MANTNEEEDVLFDEFGNPLNVSEDEYSDSESELEKKQEHQEHHQIDSSDDENEEAVDNREIVLPQEKVHFNSLESTFGPDVEITIATGDSKTIDEPMINPQITEMFRLEEESMPKTKYSKDYFWQLSDIPERVMNIAICGNIHSGKTSLIDMLVEQTHSFDKKQGHSLDTKQLKYTDNHIIEQKRGISIKSNTMSLLLPYKDVSTMVNFIDTPGHINFSDELVTSIRLADSVILCVDVVESITKSTELVIEQAIRSNTNLILMITKMDRLMMELRLPPVDMYYKLRNIVDEVNASIIKISKRFDLGIGVDEWRLSPELNNVCFSSHLFNFVFNLTSFTKMYFERYNLLENRKLTIEAFSKKLWGDVYYVDRKFKVNPENKSELANSRTFISFILEPIVKLATRTITLDSSDLKQFLQTQMKLNIPVSDLKMNQKPLLKLLFSHFLGEPSSPIMGSLKSSTPTAKENNLNKFLHLFTNTDNSMWVDHIKKCDVNGPLVAFVNRLVDTSDSSHFYAQVRVLSGSLSQNSIVKLLGEDFETENSNVKTQKIKKCYLQCGRYKIEVPSLKAGSIGLVSGPEIDTFITKTATIYADSVDIESKLPVLRSNDHIVEPVFKMGIQPKNPNDTAKFNAGLKKLTRSYHGCKVEIDETGKYFFYGFGEIYLDCALHDLRKLYGRLEINVSDPMVQFSETIDASSTVKIVTKSNNGLNTITVIAEPLDRNLSRDLTTGKLNVGKISARQLAKALRNNYGWDSLASRSIWHIGPDKRGSVILCDDTLPDDVDKEQLMELKDSIIQGFQWAIREGPLCAENVRDVKFRIIGATFAQEEIDRNSTQITQMVRKACHAAILTSQPRLMEPTFELEVIAFNDVMEMIEKLVKRRRAFITKKLPIPGSPLFRVFGRVPVIDSFGLETDLRLNARGHAFCQMISSHWDKVPGDPLDETAFIPLLKPAPYKSLARDFMIKTRRRKDLSDDVTVERFVDAETWANLLDLGVFQ